MICTRTLGTLVTLLLLLALPATVAAQPFSPDIQRIGTSDGVDIDAASPLPVTAAALSTLTTAFAVPGGALPLLAILTGMSDGTLLRALRARDLDTGAGTDYWQGVGLMLAGAGGGTPASAGAGAVDAGTIRATLGSTDPAVVSLGTLDDAFSDSGAFVTKGVAITAKTPGPGTQAYLYNTTNALWTDIRMVAGQNIRANVGNVDAGTLRVVDASIASGTSNQTAVDASEVAVLAAKAGRRFARVQVYSDVDGAVCCALGTTTNACADGILLDASPAAGKAGGSAEWEGYGGAITCRAAGAWTTTVATEEW